MTNTMRERLVEAAARAICPHLDNAAVYCCEDQTLRGLHDPSDVQAIGAATAALDAILGVLREPSEGMVDAGADLLFGSTQDDWGQEAADIFTAMIDAVGGEG